MNPFQRELISLSFGKSLWIVLKAVGFCLSSRPLARLLSSFLVYGISFLKVNLWKKTHRDSGGPASMLAVAHWQMAETGAIFRFRFRFLGNGLKSFLKAWAPNAIGLSTPIFG